MKTRLTPEFIKSPAFAAEVTKVPKIVKKYLNNGQYLTQKHKKHCVFLHHTAGTTAMGAWAWWNQTPDRVGTPYLIDRDGTIFECFDPSMWAFHLGIRGDDDSQEMNSVGIEIVAAGALKGPNNNTFYPLFPNLAGARVIPADDICELKKPWINGKFYHRYTDEQIVSLCQLLGHIKATFKDMTYPKSFSERELSYNAKVIADDYKGIYGHNSVRADKDDIFPQPNLIAAIDAFLKLEKK
jgi:N-acetyl-anhydromuramyl-L-alanine amidase AmpD